MSRLERTCKHCPKMTRSSSGFCRDCYLSLNDSKEKKENSSPQCCTGCGRETKATSQLCWDCSRFAPKGRGQKYYPLLGEIDVDQIDLNRKKSESRYHGDMNES